jgi:uncharacterized protein
MKMDLPDVNILVYAYRAELEAHTACKTWLETQINGTESFAMSTLVLSGFLRLVTNRRIFKTPAPLAEAITFIEAIQQSENCVIIAPGINHWAIFVDLCQAIQATGNDIPDAYFAALAIESNCTWITADKGFSRFPQLKWNLLEIKS